MNNMMAPNASTIAIEIPMMNGLEIPLSSEAVSKLSVVV